jgi:hypothetical protein
MKKLNITKEQFNRSNYFQRKYGKLEYVSESGRLFKTNKGKVLKFVNESEGSFFGIPGVVERHDVIIYDGCKIEPSEFWGNLGELYDQEHPEDEGHHGFDDWCWENSDLIKSELEHLASYGDDVDDFGNPVMEGADDQEKEFSYKGVVITRYDYESLPMPMAASKLDDETMQKIAEDIYNMLLDHGWEDKDIDRYLGRNLDELEDENDRDANMIKEDFWEYMENAAVANGMEYYSEMEDGDEYMESTRKFVMNESMNWNGVTDKFIDNDNVQFTRKCPSCGKPHSITVPIRDVEYGCYAYEKGATMQDAFPNFSPDEREFFMSGTCPECWEMLG